ncbi:MAG: hypothetical protein RL734_652 [Bacteroidota bacterium]|jgi:hypothetical protein
MKGNCKTCSKNINFQAVLCPNCGDPDPVLLKELQNTRKRMLLFRLPLILIFFISIAVLFTEGEYLLSGIIFLLLFAISMIISFMTNNRIKTIYSEIYTRNLVEDDEAKALVNNIYMKTIDGEDIPTKE